jgi:guanylate kinase
MKKGLLIVVSGPAGSGKGTVNAKVLQSPDFGFSVSLTTRAPRPGEVDGVNYRYVTHDYFEKMIADGGLLEYTNYCGNFYGTPLKEALEILDSGKNLLLEIEVEGALNVKRVYPEAVLIMLLPPSFAVQEQRLRGRGTETEEKICQRLATTKKELPLLDHYDYVVYNYDGGADACADDIRAIVRAESSSVKRHPNAATAYFE